MPFYNILTRLYFTAIWLASSFDKKAGQWVAGRKGIFEKIEAGLAARREGEKLVWVHCASLGEFEQGRTVIEALKKERPDVRVLLTFFSPSGYELRKQYDGADWVFYLPADTPRHARIFMDLVKPDLAFFVKYEFWYHYLHTLKQRGVPTILIAAVFRAEQPFFRWYGRLHRRMLACFTQIFVQDEMSVRLLSSVTSVPVEMAGDTRVDRVLEIVRQPKDLPLLEKFCGSGPVLVCGSTWPADEHIIFKVMEGEDLKNWKIVLAPHDVRPERLTWLEKNAPFATLRFSQALNGDGEQWRQARCLLIDNVGMLAWLYRFGRAAYIGGGFGKGIHNTLEPMAHGVPVFFGPRYKKFTEAVFLVKNGGGSVIRHPEDLAGALQKLAGEAAYKKAVLAARTYLRQNGGATEQILVFLRKMVW